MRRFHGERGLRRRAGCVSPEHVKGRSRLQGQHHVRSQQLRTGCASVASAENGDAHWLRCAATVAHV